MRVLIQRVSEARVDIQGETHGEIGRGLMLLVGIGAEDDAQAVQRMASKVAKMRIFPNDAGKFDHSLLDIGGGALVVSQFTLYADCRKGNRPSFIQSGSPEMAAPLVEQFAAALQEEGVCDVATGEFGADMQVHLCNDGPVTIWLESDA